MPEPNSIWLIASPRDADPAEMLQDLTNKVDPSGNAVTQRYKTGSATATRLASVGRAVLPEFKTATLSTLLSLSEAMAKHDQTFTSVLSKIVDTLASLDSNQLQNHLVVDDGRPYQQYIMQGWEWNRAKYRAEGRPLEELVDSFVKELNSLDGVQKQKLSNYNAVKGQLQQLQRKRTGNLATRDLSTVIDRDTANGALKDSEYMETLYVAVPKNNTKDWDQKYERLTQMVVPRSAVKVATDEEYVLYTVAVFRRVKDEFSQKCREEKFTVRDFTYDSAAIEKQHAEIESLEKQERDQWAEVVRLSRINFSEGLQLLVHLKVVRAFVECVLRYGLPASYFACFVEPEPKMVRKLIPALESHFESFCPEAPDARRGKKKKDKGGDDEGALGEFQGVLEQEVFRFALFEVPKLEVDDQQ